MRWLVLSSLPDAQSRSGELSSAMGYPRAETLTERAAMPIEHPDGGEGAVPIGGNVWSWVAGEKIDMAELLTVEEVSGLYTSAQMDDGGWFPTEDPDGLE